MKKLITNYTFTPADGTVRFNELASINHSGLLLITNVATGEIIYNFADATLGGTVAGNVITLTKDTSSMAETDALQIFYDDAQEIQSMELINALRQALANMQYPGYYERTSNALRMVSIGGTMSTITTLTNLTNLTNFGTQQADVTFRQNSLNCWANVQRPTLN